MRRYSPYLGHPKFSAVVSVLAIIFLFLFIVLYFLSPWPLKKRIIRGKRSKEMPAQVETKPVVSLPQVLATPRISEKEAVDYSIPSEIEDFLQRACVGLALYPSPDSIAGTGFLVQDTTAPNYMLLITAVHNFYDHYYIAGHRTQRLRDPIYLYLNCQQGSNTSYSVDTIRVKKSLKSKELMFYSDPGIELAIYRLKVNPKENLEFFKPYMLSAKNNFKKVKRVYYCGFGSGEFDPVLKLLKPDCNYGEIEKVAIEKNMQLIRYLLLKGCAKLQLGREVYPGESGSPVIFNFGNMQNTSEIRLCGVLYEKRGVDLPTCGIMYIDTLVLELIEQFYKNHLEADSTI